MSYIKVILDDSVLDIDSWLSKDDFSEIVETAFGKENLPLSNFIIPTSQFANYKHLANKKAEEPRNFSGLEYASFISKTQYYKTPKPYKGAA